MTEERAIGSRLSAIPVRYRHVVLVVVGLITAAAAAMTSRLDFEDSLDVWFLEDDPDLSAYRSFVAQFQSDEMMVAALAAENIFAPDALAALERFTREASRAPHVRSARSITNLRTLQGAGDRIAYAPLFAAGPQTDATAAALIGLIGATGAARPAVHLRRLCAIHSKLHSAPAPWRPRSRKRRKPQLCLKQAKIGSTILERSR